MEQKLVAWSYFIPRKQKLHYHRHIKREKSIRDGVSYK
jgi:hypothetical protein